MKTENQKGGSKIMLKLVIPKPLLEWVNSTRDYVSAPAFVVKCIAYAKIKNLSLDKMNEEIKQHLKEQGVYDEEHKGFNEKR